jgi:uncharacterized protein (DUF305 family)
VNALGRRTTASGAITTFVIAVCAVTFRPLVPDAGAQSAPSVTAADVHFMRGMIAHHAQALVMAAMAPTHGASAKVLLLCKKITISQHGEIVLMQNWLRDRNQTVPDPKDPHFNEMPGMPGMQNMMPGMLSSEQLKQLDQASDTTFDRLFLTFMIQHHEGALTMVADLFASPGSGQGADIFRYATDVDADQRAEIGRMQLMLNPLSGSQSR